jgi:endoglycosylceramidase
MRRMEQSANIQTTLPQLRKEGKYLVDPEGSVVILRGYNLCTKTAQTPEQLGFDMRNAMLLRQSGVSVVRLGVPWVNVQPYLLFVDADGDSEELQYDMQFLASIKRTIKLLSEVGIYTLVDFHQDAYSAPWGFGAPSWAMVAGGTNTPNFAWPMNTFGGSTYVLKNGPQNIETDLNAAFDAFWTDQPVSSVIRHKTNNQPFTLWETYGRMLKFVSGYLSDQQGNILGYDPINEPEPGSRWIEGYIPPSDADPSPFNFANGCPEFDQFYLAEFYRRCAIPNLRLGHPDAMIWFEPNIYFDYNAPTFLDNLEVENTGFNFHNYDSFAPAESRFLDPVNNALNYQSSFDVPLLCSEFGGTSEMADIQAVADINDQHMLSAIFWAWFNNAQFNFFAPGNSPNDPRAMGVVQQMSAELVSPNVNQAMLEILTRVYPRVTAGTPISFSTTETKKFKFEFSNQLPNNEIGTGVTLIVVPAAVYPNGFDVSAPGASIVNQHGGIVEIVVDPSTPARIVVRIEPKDNLVSQ